MEKNFIEENYIKEEVKINVVWANVFAVIVLAIAVVLFGIPFFMIWLRNVPMNRVFNTAMSLQTRLRNVTINILMFEKTLKEKKDTWIFDSPTDIGFYVYRKQE